MKIGMRNIIGDTISGNRPRPPLVGGYLLWKNLSANKILVRTSNNDKLVWKALTP